MRRWVLAGAGVVLFSALVFALWPGEGSTQPAPDGVHAAESPGAREASRTTQPHTPGGHETAPSLRGTELDGAIGFNRDGTVRVDRALRRRFDHLLSAVGEQPLAQIRAGLEADVSPIASPASVTSVMSAFDRYTSYLAAVDALRLGEGEDRVAALHRLREEKLGAAMARAFFEEEEQVDAWALERRAVLQRRDLSESERAAALEQLDLKIPAESRELATDTAALNAALAQTEALEKSGASAEEKRAARTATVGTEAAQRLGTLDDERAKWQARLEAYRTAKQAIEARGPLDEAAHRELDALLQRGFDENERRRVQVLVP